MNSHKLDRSSTLTPSTLKKNSSALARPCIVQMQQESHSPPSREERENQAFAQMKFEAVGLENKEVLGTITPIQQARLGVLQAKMNDFWVQRTERASRFSINLTQIPAHDPERGAEAPERPRVTIQPLRADGVASSMPPSPRDGWKESVQRAYADRIRQNSLAVQAKLAIGPSNDKYEQEADRVAAQVVQQINAPASTQPTQAQSVQRQEEPADTQETDHLISSSGDSIQRKMSFERETEYLDSDKNNIKLQSYVDTQKTAKDNPRGTISVQEGKPKVGTAAYTPDNLEWGGIITVQALNQRDKDTKSKKYQSRLIAVAHETRHGLDDLEKSFNFRGKRLAEKIRTEWRAFATQSAVAWEILQKSGEDQVEERYLLDLASYANKAAFISENGRIFETTQSYMILYGLPHENQDVKDFMNDHDDWVDEALKLHQDLRPAVVPAKPWHKDYGIIIVGGLVTASSVAIGLAKFFGYL